MQRVVQRHAKVAIFGTCLQVEVRNVWVRGEVERRHLATCWVMLLLHSPADARCDAGFAGWAVLGGDRYDGQLFERVGPGMEPAQEKHDKS